MTISSNDFSKHALNYTIGPERRAAEEFAALRQSNSQVVQTSADTNKAGKENRESQSQSASVKIEPSDIEVMNKKVSQLNVHLTFEMTEDRDRNIVKVLDQDTGDIVRQIPTEEFLEMAERIDAIMSQLSDIRGTLVNSEV
ncbi:flagellar protein FlaG [Marinomonas sp. C2222]|uniref:Flagellar protein FlaG n=1 Tax=Marinomonas sargassi TaxID=2984494 RepID=A0ABT2YNN1_9GAMM|nr:flagellar protein FlaG [Marinomonas sargassi]MCV2401496.1 flagellar protein FlaG [Marinomonas sargassi]